MDPLRRFRTIAAALVVLGAPAGRAAELVVEGVAVGDGEVVARIQLVELLDIRTRSAVASGLPITVRFAADLWRERRHWFDEHVDARAETFRVRWDPGERLYTLAYPGPGRRFETYERLDDLLGDLSRRDVPVHPRWALDDRSRYFAVLEVAVRPLTLEEFRELDTWIGGKLGAGEEPQDAPASGGEGLSGAVLGFLLDMAGFGDQVLRQRTPLFRPAELSGLETPPVAP